MYNEYFFVLDALRADHLKYMPWLNSKINQAVYSDNYTISEGFCERMEIFTSQKPLDLGFLTAFTLENNDNYVYPYRWLNPKIAKILTVIEFNPFFTKVLRRILWKICSFCSDFPIYPQRIPLNILHKVGITEDSIDFEKFSLNNKKGLIYKLKKKGFKIDWSLFTSLLSITNMNDDQRLNALLNYKTKNKLFIPIYISVPDKYGHKFGPNSPELINSLAILDKKCENIISNLLKSNSKSGITFVGDHGMDSVTKSINIDTILFNIESTTGLKRFVDFDFFLDSTLLRVWWKSNLKDRNIFFKHLIENKEIKEKGYIFGLNNLEDLNKDFDSIADFVWWAKKGVLINPDFFHNSNISLKGMHGYLKKDNPSSGFFLRIKEDIKKKKYQKIQSDSIDELF
jgi:hypothetical protein